jgi:tetratricopeptide (TPR) repeat protein
MKTALGLVLSTGTLVLIAEARRREKPMRTLFAAGLCGGAAALVRENFALVVMVFVVVIAWRERHGPWKGRAAAALFSGCILAILPCTVHNFFASKEIIPLTSQAGQNFYTGNYAGNPYGGYLVPDFVRRNPRFEECDFAAEAKRRLGWDLKPGEVSHYWFREGLSEIREDPLRFVRGFGTKLGLLLNNFEIPDDEDIRFFKRYAPILRLPLLTFGPVAILGLVGFFLHAIRRTLPYEIAVYVVSYAFSVALFFVFARYRLPLVAPFAVLAADRVLAIVRLARQHDWKSFAAQAAGCAAAALLVFRPIDEGTTFANSHLSVGIALELHGQPEQALVEYQNGLALEPDNAKLLRRAARLIAMRDPASDVTLRLLQRAHQADRTNVEIAFRLATAHAARGERAPALQLFEEIAARGGETDGLYANLAILYEQMGRREDAARAAQRALQTAPEDAEMQALLSRVSEPPAATSSAEMPPRPDRPPKHR